MTLGRQLVWVAGAGAAGFAASATFSGLLRWDRTAFVLPWSLVVLGVMVAFGNSVDLRPGRQIGRRWLGGVVGGLAFAAILAAGVLRQPGSAVPEGAALAGALLWLGIVYGTADALILNVLPVLALYGARPLAELQRPVRRMAWALAALAGSAAITALYHAGFAEFRGIGLIQPLIGNAIITISYLLTGSPLAPVLAHVGMHVAAVLHGAESALQLPPHY